MVFILCACATAAGAGRAARPGWPAGCKISTWSTGPVLARATDAVESWGVCSDSVERSIRSRRKSVEQIVVFSIQICVGLTVLKGWGMHPLNELATLAEVLGQFACGEMEGCSSFVYPIHLQGQPHDCYVALNSSGPFQTVFASAKVGEILPFGKYIKFVITPPDRPAVQEGLQARDAFRMMMEVQQHLSVLNKVCNERTGKDRLRNTIIDLLDRKRVGWTAAYVQTTGNRFVELLTDVLWYLDGHTATLEGRRLSVPGLFSDLTGFNKPESHGHTRAPMEASKLCTYSGALFRTTEEPRLGKSNWSEFNVATKALATNLSSYCSYLYQQREKVTKHHQSLVPIRAPTEAQSFMVISPQACTSPVHTERYKTLNCALEETEEFVPIFLNDLCPLEPRQRRYYLDNLPQAAAAHSVMFSHAYSNNLGTLHFIWRVPEGISASDLLERNMKSADLVKERRDVYHTRAMRKEATHIFGSICGIKPAFLREIYKRLTGDASASRTSNEAAVDDRIRLVLDCVDPSVVYDLRQLNEGRPEQYMKFWEECERYLESVTELAVHERRHGEVTYLAAALSASDLLSEVAKRCPEGTPIPSEAWL